MAFRGEDRLLIPAAQAHGVDAGGVQNLTGSKGTKCPGEKLSPLLPGEDLEKSVLLLLGECLKPGRKLVFTHEKPPSSVGIGWRVNQIWLK